MCITASVGTGGRNLPADGVVIQVLLNLNRPAPLPRIRVDGAVGPGTTEAIREFQRRVLHQAAPDGRVDPDGVALQALRAGLPPFDAATSLTAPVLKGIMPAATDARIALYLPGLLAGMARRHIDTPLRQAHFLAQLGHESLALIHTEEIASGAAYEGRADLGNNQPGDGTLFKGRGLVQLTGRANYTRYGQAIGRDLTRDIDKARMVATDPALAVDVACWFWQTRDLNALADADDVKAITRRVNGGYNGLDDRTAYLARARFFL
jgi:putative chitinase